MQIKTATNETPNTECRICKRQFKPGEMFLLDKVAGYYASTGNRRTHVDCLRARIADLPVTRADLIDAEQQQAELVGFLREGHNQDSNVLQTRSI